MNIAQIRTHTTEHNWNVNLFEFFVLCIDRVSAFCCGPILLLSFLSVELLLLRPRMLIGICNYEALSSPLASHTDVVVGSDWVGLGWTGLGWVVPRWFPDSSGPKEAPESTTMISSSFGGVHVPSNHPAK